MSEANNARWEKLLRYERRGDLVGQYEVLCDVLRGHSVATPTKLKETLEVMQQSNIRKEERNPPVMFSLEQEAGTFLFENAITGAVIKKIPLPRELGFIPHGQLSWTVTGTSDLLVLEPKDGKLHIFADLVRLTDIQQGLLLSAYYPYINVRQFRSQFLNLLLPSLCYGGIPIESVPSLPLDLFVSHRHPVVAVCDRGSRKTHLIHREQQRIVKSWKISTQLSKKSISVAFHPDGKRIFVTAYEESLLLLIDRQIVMKKLPIQATGILGTVCCSPKGDFLYVMRVNLESKRPDILVLDTDRYQMQACISLEGEAFSTIADPGDLFSLSRDGRWGVVMVSKNQPSLFTPCLLLIDMEKGTISDRLILTQQSKPVQIAFPTRQHFSPDMKMVPTLIQSNLITENEIQSAFGSTQT